MNDWKETLEWYKTHTTARQIGFNPDGMCLKICRTAREIVSRFLSAKQSQDATPEQYRVHKVRDLRRGMVLYFDDPNDSNTFGHIVTMIGRVKGFDWDNLDDVLVETNSVKSGELVVVKATYFKEHWGDDFQFGATWLNGVELDIPTKQTLVQRFRRSGPEYNVKLLDRAITEDKRYDIRLKRNKIGAFVDALTEDKRRTQIAKVKERFEKDRVLDMPTLDNVVQGPTADKETRAIRNGLRQVIKSLPEK